LFHIKQLTSVQDYIDKFVELVDQLIAYEPASDQRYCTACFVDGLKDDIKSVILIQRPVDLVTACTLALLQEEADIARRREYRRPNSHFKSCTQGVPVPLPLPPPPKTDKPAVAGQHSDHRASNGTRVPAPDDKIAALRAYRRARGLCQFCAEKWSRGHKCASSVPL
jgi:hypothetical protein